MNNIKKIFGLGLIGIALAMSVPASAKITANRLAANRLSSNSSELAGNGAFNDVSEVVLADGTRLTR
jgi:hypothetical protein